jgi:hypothetical protein
MGLVSEKAVGSATKVTNKGHDSKGMKDLFLSDSSIVDISQALGSVLVLNKFSIGHKIDTDTRSVH